MIDFNLLQNFFIVLMAILGFVSVVGGVVNMFRNWHKESTLTKHENIITNHEQRLKKLEEKTDEQEQFIHVRCSSNLAIVKHLINGNSIDALKQAEAELQNFLINK